MQLKTLYLDYKKCIQTKKILEGLKTLYIRLTFVLTGPPNSPYEQEKIPYTVYFPENYPFGYPQIKINKLIFHPEYFNGNAECCFCWYQQKWHPAKALRSLIQDFIDILLKPRCSHENCASNLIQKSQFEFFETAWTYHKEKQQREQCAVNIKEIINLPCYKQHNLPIVEVIIDKRFKQNSMLICQICQLSINEIKTIDVNQLVQKLECNRLSRMLNIEDLENNLSIQKDIFQNCIEKIKQIDALVFQELIIQKNNWIVSGQDFKSKVCSLSILEEIEQVSNEPKENKKILKQQIQSINELFLEKVYQCINKLVSEQDRQNYKEVIQKVFKKTHLKYKFENISHKFLIPSPQPHYAISINFENTFLLTISYHFGRIFQIYQISKRQNDHQYQLTYFTAFNVGQITRWIINIKFLSTQPFTFVCTNRNGEIFMIFPTEYEGSKPINWNYKRYNINQHSDYVSCLVVRQSDDLVVCGQLNEMIQFLQISNETNQLITLSESQVWGLSFNEKGDRLLSCQQNNEITLMEQKEQWVIKQKILMDGFGYRICFITDEIFAIQTKNSKTKQQYQYLYFGFKKSICQKWIPFSQRRKSAL